MFLITLRDNYTIQIKKVFNYWLLIFKIASVITIYIFYKAIKIDITDYNYFFLFNKLQKSDINNSKMKYALPKINHSFHYFEKVNIKICIIFNQL